MGVEAEGRMWSGAGQLPKYCEFTQAGCHRAKQTWPFFFLGVFRILMIDNNATKASLLSVDLNYLLMIYLVSFY